MASCWTCLYFLLRFAFTCLHAVAGSTDVNESVVLSAGGDACVHDASGAEGVCAGVKFGASAQMSASLEEATLLFGVKRGCM